MNLTHLLSLTLLSLSFTLLSLSFTLAEHPSGYPAGNGAAPWAWPGTLDKIAYHTDSQWTQFQPKGISGDDQLCLIVWDNLLPNHWKGVCKGKDTLAAANADWQAYFRLPKRDLDGNWDHGKMRFRICKDKNNIFWCNSNN